MKVGDKVKITGYYSIAYNGLVEQKTHSYNDCVGVITCAYPYPEDAWDYIVDIDGYTAPFNKLELEVIQ